MYQLYELLCEHNLSKQIVSDTSLEPKTVVISGELGFGVRIARCRR